MIWTYRYQNFHGWCGIPSWSCVCCWFIVRTTMQFPYPNVFGCIPIPLRKQNSLHYTLGIQSDLVSMCLNPHASPEKAFKGSKHPFTRYLEDFGYLGISQFCSYLVSPKNHCTLQCRGEWNCLSQGCFWVLKMTPRLMGQDSWGVFFFVTTLWYSKEPGMMYFPTKWGAKEPQNPQNPRVVNLYNKKHLNNNDGEA